VLGTNNFTQAEPAIISLHCVHDILQANACEVSSPVNSDAATTEAPEGVAIPLQSAPRLTFGLAEQQGLRPDMEDRSIVSTSCCDYALLY
jgi:hypothetical protein